MTKKTSDQNELSKPEMRLIGQLRVHPEILARVQSILELAENAEGPLKTADEVVTLLIQEGRQLVRQCHHEGVGGTGREASE